MSTHLLTSSSTKLNAKNSPSTYKVPPKNCPKTHANLKASIERVINSEIFKTCTDYVNGDPLIRKSQLIRVIERTLNKHGSRAERLKSQKQKKDKERKAIDGVTATKLSSTSEPAPCNSSAEGSSDKPAGSSVPSNEVDPIRIAIEKAKEFTKLTLSLTKSHSLIGFNHLLQVRINNLEHRLKDTMERVTNVYGDVSKITDPRSAQRALNFCQQLQHEIKKLSQVRKHFLQYFKRHETRKRIEEELRQKLNLKSDYEPDMEQQHAADLQTQYAKKCRTEGNAPYKTEPSQMHSTESAFTPEYTEKNLCAMKLEQLKNIREGKSNAAPKAEREEPSAADNDEIYVKSIPMRSGKIQPTGTLIPDEFEVLENFGHVDMHNYPREFVEDVRSDYLRRVELDRGWYVPTRDSVTNVPIKVKKPYQTIYASPAAKDVVQVAPRSTLPGANQFRTYTDTLTAEIRANARERNIEATLARERAKTQAQHAEHRTTAANLSQQPPARTLSRTHTHTGAASDERRTRRQAKRQREAAGCEYRTKERHLQLGEELCDEAMGGPGEFTIEPTNSQAKHLASLTGDFCLFRMKYYNRLCYKRSKVSSLLNTRDGYCTYPDKPKKLDIYLMPKVRRKSFAEFLVLTPDRMSVHRKKPRSDNGSSSY